MKRLTNVLDLPDELLSRVLRECDVEAKLTCLPLVCKRLGNLLKTPLPNVWGIFCLEIRLDGYKESLTLSILDGETRFRRKDDDPSSLLHWFLQRASGFDGLHLVVLEPRDIGDSENSMYGSLTLWQFLAGTWSMMLGATEFHPKQIVLEFPAHRNEYPVAEDLATEIEDHVMDARAKALGQAIQNFWAGMQSLTIRSCHRHGLIQALGRGLLSRGGYSRLEELVLDTKLAQLGDTNAGNAISLHTLTKLRIYCGGQSVPKFDCPNLTSIDLFEPKFRQFPQWITRLPRLEVCRVSGEYKKKRDDDDDWLFERHEGRATTDVGSGLDDWEQGLNHLKELSLQNCQVTTLPAQFSRCVSLTSLVLRDNQIPALPSCLTHMTSLTSLDLSGNHLSTIPLQLSELRGLTRLDLGDQQHSGLLQSGPLDDLFALSNLEVLTLPATEPTGDRYMVHFWEPVDDVLPYVESAAFVGRFMSDLPRVFQRMGKRPPTVLQSPRKKG